VITLAYISSVITLTDKPTPMFQPGGILWLTIKSRANTCRIVTSIEGGQDGYTIPEGASQDFPNVGGVGIPLDLSGLYWMNDTKGTNTVIELIGQTNVRGPM